MNNLIMFFSFRIRQKRNPVKLFSEIDMSLRKKKKKQNERKKHKLNLKETLTLVQESKLFLKQQTMKIETMNLSKDEK